MLYKTHNICHVIKLKMNRVINSMINKSAIRQIMSQQKYIRPLSSSETPKSDVKLNENLNKNFNEIDVLQNKVNEFETRISNIEKLNNPYFMPIYSMNPVHFVMALGFVGWLLK